MREFYKNIGIPITAAAFGIFFILIQLLTSAIYPIFRDEFYYLDCANHPAFGYVDHPPLSIWILMVWKFIFGDSQISIRIIPALSGGLLIILTSIITKNLGGSKLAQVFASVAVFSGLYYWATGAFYSMNVFDSVFWALLFLALIKIIKFSPAQREIGGGITNRTAEFTSGNAIALRNWWLLFGIIAGFGLMNKISVGYLGLGILTAILLTQNRAWLKQKNIWLAGLIAFAIFSPYIIWNIANDFATLEFIRNAQQYKIAALEPLDFIKEQVLQNNPLAAPLWIAGLITLLILKRNKQFRIIGITYIVILAFLIIMRSKAYYLAAAYPVLIAAGAVLISPSSRGAGLPVPKDIGAQEGGENKPGKKQKIINILVWIYSVILLAGTAKLSPLVIPVLPPGEASVYIKQLGITPSTGENSRLGELPQLLADRFGWIELAEKVAAIYNTLPESEKKTTAIFAGNYGEAGAINYYGKIFGLPQCYSGHNNHYYWGPPDSSVTTLIIIGGGRDDHLKTFNEVTLMDSTYHPFAMPYENGKPIYLARGLKKPLKEVWESVKFYI